MDIHFWLVFGHIAGAILGVGGATLAEVFLVQALRDGRIDASERQLMHANYFMIRVGMGLILLSGLGLVWFYWAQGVTWPITSPKLWMKDLMFIVILANAVLLSKRLVPLWLGASLSFTSWWGATLLGVAGPLPYSFWQILIVYVVAIFVVAGILELIHRAAFKKP